MGKSVSVAGRITHFAAGFLVVESDGCNGKASNQLCKIASIRIALLTDYTTISRREKAEGDERILASFAIRQKRKTAAKSNFAAVKSRISTKESPKEICLRSIRRSAN